MAADNRENQPEIQVSPPREAEGLIGLACLLIAIILLLLVPIATKSQPADKSWFLSPRNMPILGLVTVALAASIMTAGLIRGYRVASDKRAYLDRAFWAFRDLGPAFGFAALFCVYLFIIPWLGFALSTFLFGQVCLWCADLRSGKWVFANLGFTIAIVLILRVGMGLWFPQAAVFEWLPDSVGNAIGRYL